MKYFACNLNQAPTKRLLLYYCRKAECNVILPPSHRTRRSPAIYTLQLALLLQLTNRRRGDQHE